MGNTRRDFLSLLIFSMGAALSPELILSRSCRADSAGGGKVTVTMTGGEKRLSALDPLAWHAPGSAAADTITIDPGKKYQSMLGFGGAFSDASCYTFNKMPSEKRHKLLEQFFGSGTDSLGLNVCRTCIGASDYSTKVYSFDEGEADPDLKRFSIAHDLEYILPVLRQARKNQSGPVSFFHRLEPSGLDEIKQVNAGRQYAKTIHELLRRVFRQIFARL